jgi:hypothetical protein
VLLEQAWVESPYHDAKQDKEDYRGTTCYKSIYTIAGIIIYSIYSIFPSFYISMLGMSFLSTFWAGAMLFKPFVNTFLMKNMQTSR